jgi:hypothetical protein
MAGMLRETGKTFDFISRDKPWLLKIDPAGYNSSPGGRFRSPPIPLPAPCGAPSDIQAIDISAAWTGNRTKREAAYQEH